jgi:hypothetical protein
MLAITVKSATKKIAAVDKRQPLFFECNAPNAGKMIGGTLMTKWPQRGLYARLLQQIDHLNRMLERANLVEYMQLIQSPRRMFFLNFFAGVARGFGIAVGFTIIGALFVYLLTRLASLNLPIIGEFIAQLVRIVEQQLR